jgi:hypothetical protein
MTARIGSHVRSSHPIFLTYLRGRERERHACWRDGPMSFSRPLTDLHVGLAATFHARVVECFVRWFQPGPGPFPFGPSPCPLAVGEGGRRPGEGLGIRTTTAKPTARLPIARPGPEIQDFEETLRASLDDRNGKGVLTTRPSPPLRNVSFSLGGRGTRRARLGYARLEPRLPGGFWQGNRPQRDPVFFLAPTGAPEKVRTELA